MIRDIKNQDISADSTALSASDHQISLCWNLLFNLEKQSREERNATFKMAESTELSTIDIKELCTDKEVYEDTYEHQGEKKEYKVENVTEDIKSLQWKTFIITPITSTPPGWLYKILNCIYASPSTVWEDLDLSVLVTCQSVSACHLTSVHPLQLGSICL